MCENEAHQEGANMQSDQAGSIGLHVSCCRKKAIMGFILGSFWKAMSPQYSFFVAPKRSNKNSAILESDFGGPNCRKPFDVEGTAARAGSAEGHFGLILIMI